jgi:hypothetical protein
MKDRTGRRQKPFCELGKRKFSLMLGSWGSAFLQDEFGEWRGVTETRIQKRPECWLPATRIVIPLAVK